MTPPKKRVGGMTAAELMAQLEGDEDYQRRRREEEEAQQARVEKLRRAEQPIVADLRSAGFDVESVWDLVNTSTPYPDALPVLLRHLERGGYLDWVMASLARALAVRPTAFAWDTFRRLYLKAEGSGEEEGLAIALAESATPDHLDGLIALLDAPKGDSRVHLLRAIERVGGSRGREVVWSLRSDPTFGQEARRVLKTRR